MLYLAFFSKREEQIHSNFDRRSFILARIQHNKEIRVANFTSKNVGLGKFFQDLDISEAFMIRLEVSFFHGLFLLF